jgi:hypothetical protein
VAVVFKILRAVRAVFFQTAAGLGADADALALLDVLYVFANFDGFADDFVANDAGWERLAYLVWECRMRTHGRVLGPSLRRACAGLNRRYHSE